MSARSEYREASACSVFSSAAETSSSSDIGGGGWGGVVVFAAGGDAFVVFVVFMVFVVFAAGEDTSVVFVVFAAEGDKQEGRKYTSVLVTPCSIPLDPSQYPPKVIRRCTPPCEGVGSQCEEFHNFHATV